MSLWSSRCTEVLYLHTGRMRISHGSELVSAEGFLIQIIPTYPITFTSGNWNTIAFTEVMLRRACTENLHLSWSHACWLNSLYVFECTQLNYANCSESTLQAWTLSVLHKAPILHHEVIRPLPSFVHRRTATDSPKAKGV